MKNYIFLIVVIFLVISCVDKVDTQNLTIKNTTERDIYTIISKIKNEDSLNDYGFFGDFRDSLVNNSFKSINRPIDWKWYIENSIGHKFNLYIIKKDSVDEYGWEEIHTKNLYNKKYLLDIDDLDSLNWTIEYNGN